MDPNVPPEQLRALQLLLHSYRSLEHRAASLCHGSSELARAWRAWSTLAKLRRQLQMLGRHIVLWREQQLQRERWLADAKLLVQRMQAHGKGVLEERAAAVLQKWERKNMNSM
ncbi:hypothetical protein AB1Y20_023625 [Prymnesium parvum]|uniref:Uncharacterized protein n=1 Tax=Prymnesium parvum TaxID=97485 RepID=A0AB34JE07_PRYPA